MRRRGRIFPFSRDRAVINPIVEELTQLVLRFDRSDVRSSVFFQWAVFNEELLRG
jgi:hypothetical protein